MKKIIVMLVCASMVFSFAACGTKGTANENKPEESTAETAEEEKEEEPEAEIETEETISDEDMAELEALGDVEVENGILTVSITVPADIVGEEITQEELDADVGETYQKATLNSDGSVTYKMTKAQHKNMLLEISSSIEESLQELTSDDETYSIANIEHNDDFTEFNVYEDGTEVGFADSFASIVFYMYGEMYGLFTGKQPENVVVNYLDPDGNLIEQGNSADME